MQKPIKHGTYSGYNYRKCRCEPCKEAGKDWNRNYRDQNRDKIQSYGQKWCHENRAKKCQYGRKTKTRKRELLQQIKVESGCVDCGYREHPEALDFDHIDHSTKLFCLSSLSYSRTLAAIMLEISKCEIRCSNCHRVRTAVQRKERGLRR